MKCFDNNNSLKMTPTYVFLRISGSERLGKYKASKKLTTALPIVWGFCPSL